MDIATSKNNLREYYKRLRRDLLPASMTELSNQINQNFLENLLPKIPNFSQKIFSIYSPSYNEVSPKLIFEHFKKHNLRCALPRIVERDQPMEFILVEETTNFVPNRFFPKIREPQFGTAVIPDVIILPTVAFDHNLSRLGMGGGFFDRTIENFKMLKPQILTIALAYDFQRAHTPLPTENTDQKLDFIVTEKTIFSAS